MARAVDAKLFVVGGECFFRVLDLRELRFCQTRIQSGGGVEEDLSKFARRDRFHLSR